MPYSYVVYTGNGSTTQFAITFPYIRKEHVKVYVNYVDTAYTYVNDTTVQLAAAPASPLRVEVRRVTPLSTRLVDYTDGSTLVAADLDTSNLQSLYNEQELDDSLKQTVSIDPATGLPSAGGQRITNVGNPTSAQDAATKSYVDTADALKVAKAGDSMTGALAMGSNKITGLGTPTANADAATKLYVDTVTLAGNVPDGDRGDITVSGVGTSWAIDAGAVVEAKLGTGAVTETKLGTGAVTSAKILDGTILNADVNATAGIVASKLSFTQAGTGAVARTVDSKLKDTMSVKDFGAVGNGVTDDTAAIQAALNAHQYIIIPSGTYNISASIKPKNGQRLFFEGGKLFTTGIIVTDECAIKVVDASDVEIWNANIDCDNQPANSGIIVRENTSNIRIYNTQVTKAAWDAIKGGGRAIIIEANTGDVGKIIVDGLTATQVDTVIGIYGSAIDGMRKNAIVVTNVVAKTVNKLIALFGPDSDATPNTADLQQSIITNVVGYDVTLPIRYANGSDAIIDNVYVYNKTLSIGPAIQGFARNVRITNFVMNGTVTALLDASPWLDDNTTPAFTPGSNGSRKCHYQITHRGTVSLAVLISQYTHNGIISDTTFDLNVDTVTTDVLGNTAINVNTTVYVNLFSAASRARISGYLNAIGTKLISSATLKDFLQSAAFPTNQFVPTIIGSTTAGTATYSVAKGTYTNIGNVVFFNCYLTWSGHTGTGSMRVGGLPFTASAVANTQTAVAVAFMDSLALFAGNILSAYVDVGQTYVVLVQTPTGGGGASGVTLDTAGSLMVAGHYLID